MAPILSRFKRNEDLEHLVETELKPSPEFLKAGRDAMNHIYRALQKRSFLQVDRIKVGGSIGKGTAIDDTDFDVVVFLNSHEPPFRQRVFDEMLAALKTVPGYCFTKKTRYSISFQIRINQRALDFDLLPAQNLLNHDKHSDDMARQQAVQVRHRMGKFARPSVFSASLAEQTIFFMKKKPDDVVKVIKLARYWNQQIEIDEYVKGRSYMIELVAAWAQHRQPACSLFNRFVRFLREMQDFSNLCIFFGHHYRKTSFPSDVWNQTPLVMDPCNPYNNLAEGIDPNVVEIFKSAAARSLAVIKNGLTNVEDLFFDNDEYYDDYDEEYDDEGAEYGDEADGDYEEEYDDDYDYEVFEYEEYDDEYDGGDGRYDHEDVDMQKNWFN